MESFSLFMVVECKLENSFLCGVAGCNLYSFTDINICKIVLFKNVNFLEEDCNKVKNKVNFR